MRAQVLAAGEHVLAAARLAQAAGADLHAQGGLSLHDLANLVLDEARRAHEGDEQATLAAHANFVDIAVDVSARASVAERRGLEERERLRDEREPLHRQASERWQQAQATLRSVQEARSEIHSLAFGGAAEAQPAAAAAGGAAVAQLEEQNLRLQYARIYSEVERLENRIASLDENIPRLERARQDAVDAIGRLTGDERLSAQLQVARALKLDIYKQMVEEAAMHSPNGAPHALPRAAEGQLSA
jgi:chromosome segregation ATPase